MAYTVDRTSQLVDANRKGYKSLATRLRAAGTPSKQHNSKVTKSVAKKSEEPAKKASAKKSGAKKK